MDGPDLSVAFCSQITPKYLTCLTYLCQHETNVRESRSADFWKDTMTHVVSLAVFKLVLGQHDAWGSLYEGRAGRPETQSTRFIFPFWISQHGKFNWFLQVLSLSPKSRSPKMNKNDRSTWTDSVSRKLNCVRGAQSRAMAEVQEAYLMADIYCCRMCWGTKFSRRSGSFFQKNPAQ